MTWLDHTPESASYSSIFLLAKDWSIKRPFTVPRMCWISHQGHFRELNWRYLQQDMPRSIDLMPRSYLILSRDIPQNAQNINCYQLIVSKMALRTSISGILSVPDHPFPAFLGGATLIPPKITFMMSRFMASFAGAMAAMDRWPLDWLGVNQYTLWLFTHLVN